jgi:hypothetical protein
MKTFSFSPGACYEEKGKTFRPFLIDGKEIYRLDMSVMLGDDKDASHNQLTGLCAKILELTGKSLTPGDLPDLLKTRKIEVNNA